MTHYKVVLVYIASNDSIKTANIKQSKTLKLLSYLNSNSPTSSTLLELNKLGHCDTHLAIELDPSVFVLLSFIFLLL